MATTTLDYIQAAGAALAAASALIPEIAQLIDSMKTVFSTGQPTAADWDALHKVLDANTATLNAPMEGEAPSGNAA